jgi:sRNA-binding carbon storage regulator CsrA
VGIPIYLQISEVKKGVNMPKFMQTLDEEIYNKLQEIANSRGITIQELIRAVIIPDWLKET